MARKPIWYVIQCETNENLFWSNNIGWVNISDATVFTQRDRSTLNLPIEGKWVIARRVGAHAEYVYRDLKHGAKIICENHGHTMKNFERINSIVTINNPARIVGRSECSHCGKTVYVDTQPEANEIKIGGGAWATDCQR